MNNKAFVVSTADYAGVGPINYLEFNLRVPPLNDVRVRRAIAHAIDKDFITKTLHKGISRRLDGPFHSGAAMYDAAAVKQYAYDLKAASALMDEAGLKPDSSGVRLKLTLQVPTFEQDSSALVAEYLRGQLRRIGIEITLRKATDTGDWSSRVGNWNYDMTMNSTFNWGDPVVGVHRNFVSSNIRKVIWTNTQGYNNPAVDDLLARATVERDPVKRRALYAEFQTIVTTELPFVWTNEGIYTTVYDKNLTGVPTGVYGPMAPWDEMRFTV
jgi:peptide/nickel transport system substrate-binding protein